MNAGSGTTTGAFSFRTGNPPLWHYLQRVETIDIRLEGSLRCLAAYIKFTPRVLGDQEGWQHMFPRFTLVRQVIEQPRVADPYFETQNQWRKSRILKRVKPGDRIAIGCGSRGIASYQSIVRATLEVFNEAGARPFLVAAMGSHGNASPDGQRELLAAYGLTEAELGVEVRTDMTAEKVGFNNVGDPVWWDANALAADGVVTISRVKPHTDFRGKYESGVTKMAVIGLGKREGAATHHRWGVRGLRDILPDSARVILEKTKFLGGLAILENIRDETALLRVLDRDELLAEEPKLLDQARGMLGKIPFDQLDLLVIGEIGKNYSGSGIDPNVVGRFLVETCPELEPATPKITRIAALDLSPESHGNGTGIGIADVTTQRAVDAIDWKPTRMNNLTACCLWRTKIPLVFPNDRACLEAALATCWQPIAEKQRVAIVPNSLEVAEMWVSPPVLEDVKLNPNLKAEQTRAIECGGEGNLPMAELFPHSVRAKRRK